ncbi:MAG: 2Fe-2S iron-sulfur cluster-binding protein [Woeseiaceae bacterium]|nr:2Fe-2S iron-sulfur cluster-binding protein [Woeseiaceae bacterium]
MKQYHPLTVAAKRPETRDSVRIALEVPAELQDEFSFQAGQHLPVSVKRDGKTLRRTYSICSVPGDWPLEIGVRVQAGGAFSEYAADELAVGDEILVMPPGGQFHAEPDAGKAKTYLGFAAGSGITPVLSIMATILRDEPDSRFALFYGNRRQSTTMFIDELFALKNRYPDRLQLQFVFSQEDQEFPIAAGRLDADKVRDLYTAFCRGTPADEAFVCGPDTMIDAVSAALVELGLPPEAVHSERFGVPRKTKGSAPEKAAETTGAAVTVVMDGHRKHFDMDPSDDNVVDAAAEHGIELPYSCKGGVCATCRCHVREGEVVMATNYGLEPWEVEAGFVLACQSRPVSAELVLDYDKT